MCMYVVGKMKSPAMPTPMATSAAAAAALVASAVAMAMASTNYYSVEDDVSSQRDHGFRKFVPFTKTTAAE